MDNDDTIHLRELCYKFNAVTELYKKSVENMSNLETELDIGIIKEDISDKLSWKKNVLELIKKNNLYMNKYISYNNAKKEVKVSTSGLKALEVEINSIKKIHDHLPKG